MLNSIIKNQRKASLLNLLNKHNPDIVLLCKTKLGKTYVMKLKHYNLIRNDRLAHKAVGGGAAILIRKSIKFEEIVLARSHEFKLLKFSIIKLKIKDRNNLILISAYDSCGNQKEFISELNNLFSILKLDKYENFYLIAGDFNAKHED